MRALAAWILALGLVATPAMAGAGGTGEGDSASKSANSASASPKAEPAKAAEPSSVELANEIQQLRDLIESQSAQIQAQNEQLKVQQEQKDEKFHKVESFYGSFSRSFALPEGTDPDSIRAESKDGVLTIHVPKSRTEASKATTIKVQ